MPRQKTTLAELRVGLLAIVTIAILIIFILSVSGDISFFKDTVTYTTRFSAAEGLKSGDEVRVAGKLVGKVDSVELMSQPPATKNEKPIVVTMQLEADEVKGLIRQDSQAVLAQQGFLGDRVIDIIPGTRGADALPSGSEIPSADQSGLAQVFQGASDILVQFNTVGKQLQELMDNINRGEGTIGKLLHDEALYVNLNRTVVDFQTIARRMAEGNGTIAKFLNDPKLYEDLRGVTANVQGMVADIRGGKGTLGKFINDDQFYVRASELLGKFNETATRLNTIASDIEAGRGTLGKFLKDDQLHTEVQATIVGLRQITDSIQKGEGTIGKLLHDDKLYNNFNQTSSEIVKLLYDFRQNPRKYLSIRVSLF